MRERLKQMNEEKFGKSKFEIRIGINSGRVVAGDIGSPKRIEYTVLGNTVNIASRLESTIARPGQIVVGEATYHLISGLFLMEPLGEFNLRGLENLITVYEVLSERPSNAAAETTAES
jgi:adenylate cyclase